MGAGLPLLADCNFLSLSGLFCPREVESGLCLLGGL